MPRHQLIKHGFGHRRREFFGGQTIAPAPITWAPANAVPLTALTTDRYSGRQRHRALWCDPDRNLFHGFRQSGQEGIIVKGQEQTNIDHASLAPLNSVINCQSNVSAPEPMTTITFSASATTTIIKQIYWRPSLSQLVIYFSDHIAGMRILHAGFTTLEINIGFPGPHARPGFSGRKARAGRPRSISYQPRIATSHSQVFDF